MSYGSLEDLLDQCKIYLQPLVRVFVLHVSSWSKVSLTTNCTYDVKHVPINISGKIYLQSVF